MNAGRIQPVYTVGHSNLEFGSFLRLLKQQDIQAVADVRSLPYSQYNPQYNREALLKSLQEQGIAYAFLGQELGARRPERECYLEGRADYELISRTPAFQYGIDRIVHGAERLRIALVCAEKDPIDCHRCILISPQLQREGIRVRHVLPDGSVEDHVETERRLLRLFGFDEGDLFASAEENLVRAYKLQGEKIAYHEDLAMREPSPDYGD